MQPYGAVPSPGRRPLTVRTFEHAPTGGFDFEANTSNIPATVQHLAKGGRVDLLMIDELGQMELCVEPVLVRVDRHLIDPRLRAAILDRLTYHGAHHRNRHPPLLLRPQLGMAMT